MNLNHFHMIVITTFSLVVFSCKSRESTLVKDNADNGPSAGECARVEAYDEFVQETNFDPNNFPMSKSQDAAIKVASIKEALDRRHYPQVFEIINQILRSPNQQIAPSHTSDNEPSSIYAEIVKIMRGLEKDKIDLYHATIDSDAEKELQRFPSELITELRGEGMTFPSLTYRWSSLGSKILSRDLSLLIDHKKNVTAYRLLREIEVMESGLEGISSPVLAQGLIVAGEVSKGFVDRIEKELSKRNVTHLNFGGRSISLDEYHQEIKIAARQKECFVAQLEVKESSLFQMLVKRNQVNYRGEKANFSYFEHVPLVFSGNRMLAIASNHGDIYIFEGRKLARTHKTTGILHSRMMKFGDGFMVGDDMGYVYQFNGSGELEKMLKIPFKYSGAIESIHPLGNGKFVVVALEGLVRYDGNEFQYVTNEVDHQHHSPHFYFAPSEQDVLFYWHSGIVFQLSGDKIERVDTEHLKSTFGRVNGHRVAYQWLSYEYAYSGISTLDVFSPNGDLFFSAPNLTDKNGSLPVEYIPVVQSDGRHFIIHDTSKKSLIFREGMVSLIIQLPRDARVSRPVLYGEDLVYIDSEGRVVFSPI